MTDAEVREMLLLFLKTAEAAKSQGMWAASRSRKRQENRFSPRASGSPADTFTVLQ